MGISVFVGLLDWYFCTICAVLSRSITPELRTKRTKCYAMITLKKNLILVAKEKKVEEPSPGLQQDDRQ